MDSKIRFGLFDFRHLMAEMEMKSLFLQHALKLLGDLGIGARQNAVQKFDDGHLGAKPAPDRAEFETDDARPDNDEFLGNTLQRQRAGRGDDGFLIDLDAGKPHDIGAGRDDDIFCFDLLRGTIVRLDFDDARRGDRPGAEERVDLVLLEKKSRRR